jgi:hypothetical protein
MEETVASARAMSELADELRGAMQRFQTGRSGGGAS